MKNKNEKLNVYLGIAIIFILFILVSFFVENNLGMLKNFAKQYFYLLNIKAYIQDNAVHDPPY